MENPNQSNDGDSASGSLWGIANGSGLGLHGGPTGGGMMSPPPSWNPQLGEGHVEGRGNGGGGSSL